MIQSIHVIVSSRVVKGTLRSFDSGRRQLCCGRLPGGSEASFADPVEQISTDRRGRSAKGVVRFLLSLGVIGFAVVVLSTFVYDSFFVEGHGLSPP